MADFDANFRYDSDFTKVTQDIKNLVREATNANSVFAQLNKTAASVKMEAARSFSAQAGFAGFKAQIVDLTGATEQFGQQLMKNKLTMKEYFREAANAYKKDSKARALAEREVRRAQSAVVGMGDVGGRRKGILLTPDSLDMSKSTTQLQIASKQYEIFNDLVQKGSTALVNWGKNTQWAGRQLTVGLTVPMGIFTAQALKAFAGLDAEVTRFRKVYGSELTGTVGDATDQMVAQIKTLGSEFAKQYGIASKETMALAADLAAAGLEGEKLANAVNQTTRMMVLGEVDRQEAMKATLSIQTAFNQSSRELAQSVDFLNAVENQTSASLQDLVEAIPKTGPVIQALGGDIKDLSVLMTAMREGGINAAEGANALKSGMASLISPTTKAIEVAKQFGIDLQGIVNSNRGQLMPMLTAFQEQLQGLDDFGKAKIIEEIFGKYQFARISALFDNLNAQGSQTVGMMKLMTASADDLAKKSYSELKAQENAPSTRLAAMQQQLQEQLIKVGADLAETLLPVMQGALDILSKIVDGFNNLPEPIKNFAKIIGGITAASGPILMLAGIFGNLIGNAMKFGMSIVNMFKKMTGHPVKQLQILSDEELAAKLSADQLTGAYARQRTSVMELNAALDIYIANLREAALIAPPGAVSPGGRGPRPPIRRAEGGIIYAQNGVDSGGRINGYGGGDTVPALLEPGEFVINKKSSQKYAPLLRDINQGKDVAGYNGGTNNGVSDAYKNINLQQSESGTPIGSRILKNVIQKREGDPILDSLSKTAKRMSESYPVGSEVEKWAEKLGNIKQFNPDKWAQFEPYPVNKLPAVLQPMAAGLNDIAEMNKRIIAANPKASLAASHMADTGVAGLAQLEGGSVKLTAVKEFIGTTMLESFGFNSLIQSMGGGSKPNPTKVANNLIANLPETHPLRAPGTLEKLTAMMSGAGAPVTANDTKLMIDFFKEIDKNPGLKTAFNLNSGTNAAQFNESKAYLNFLSEMVDDPKRFNQFRKTQMINSVFSSVKETELAKMLGTADKLKQYEILDREYSKVEKILNNPKLTESQRRAAVEKTVATISRRITGRDVLQGKRLENLRYKQASPMPENATTTVMTAEGKLNKVIVAGKELYRDASGLTYVKTSKGFIPYDMEKNAAMNRAVPLQENQIGKLSRVAEEKFAARAAFTEKERRGWAERLSTKIGPRGVRMMYWRGVPIRFAKNGGLIPGYAGGGMVGLMQILSRAEQRALPNATEMLQKGFKVSTLKGAELAAVRKKQTGLIHDTKMFRGTKYNWDDVQVGQEIRLPGSQSWSTREDVADSFRAMNELGAEKNAATISADTLLRAGIDPKTFGRGGAYEQFRTATNAEEFMLLNRIERIKEQQRGRRSLDKRRELLAERKALESSPLPSQEQTLFGMTEPLPHEVANRQRALQEIDRKIHGADVDYMAAKEQMTRRRNNMRAANESPVIFEMVTPKGTQTLPLSDITGRGRNIKGMGAMDEFEHLITDGTMRVVKKYVDERGVKRIVGEFVGAKKFATGGKLPGYGGGDTVPAMLEPGEFVINKESSSKYAPLLENINRDSLPGFEEGWTGPKSLAGKTDLQQKFLKGQKMSQMGGGMMGAGMSMMFLPMSLEMFKTAQDPLTKALGAATIAMTTLQVGIVALGAAIKMNTLAQGMGGWGSMLTKKIPGVGLFKAGNIAKTVGTARVGANPVLTGKLAANQAKNAGGGFISQKIASAGARGIAKGGMAAVATRVGLGIVTKGIPIVGWAYAIAEVGKMIRDWKIGQWVEQITDVFGEATEMAKVYNIELKKTGQALKENTESAKSFGLAAAVQGRGQVEKDYAAAITKDYGSAIERIKGGDKKSQQADLTAMYASLVTQGFDLKQAQEITAEVARQAEATSAYNGIVSQLGDSIKNTSDAMSVLSTNFGAQLEGLGTSEEQINAFLAVLDNLRRSSSDDPIQFGESVQNITEMIQKTGQLEDSLGEFLIGAGFNEEDRNKMYENLFGGDPVNFGTEKGQQVAEALIRAVNAGLDPKKLKNLSLEEINIEIGVAEAGQKAKNELNKQMEAIIKDLDKQIEGINKLADDSIDKINKEKEALAAAHEARMKQLEAEAEALQDRADLIRDNTAFYLSQLQKEYDAEQYYQKQRETALGGLEALSKGDIFGYVKSQMQSASDAEQFGREQSMQQIQDTQDNALSVIDGQLKANSKAQQAAGDSFQAQMDAKDKEIEKINTERSARLKEINSLKKDAQEIIDLAAGEVATTKLQAFEDKALGIADKLPAKMKTNVIAATSGVVEDFNVALNDAVGKAAKNLGVDPMAIAGILEDAYATKVGGMNFSFNASGFKIVPTGTKQKSNPPGKAVPVGGLNSGGVVGGVGNTDTVPAMLTPGEFVVNKDATRRNMGSLMQMNAGGRVGYNSGGYVGGMPALGFKNGGLVPNYRMPSMKQANMASNSSTENEVKYITVNQSVIVNGANQSAGDIANQVIAKLNRMKREMGSKYGTVMM